MRNALGHFRIQDRGSAGVEMALVTPIFLALMFGSFEMGYYFLSEHAVANAIDIRGFVLDDGRIVSLARHWSSAKGPEAAFLREVNDGACRFFNAVLGPDYNAAHRDHFHLDMGRWRVCR